MWHDPQAGYLPELVTVLFVTWSTSWISTWTCNCTFCDMIHKLNFILNLLLYFLWHDPQAEYHPELVTVLSVTWSSVKLNITFSYGAVNLFCFYLFFVSFRSKLFLGKKRIRKSTKIMFFLMFFNVFCCCLWFSKTKAILDLL